MVTDTGRAHGVDEAALLRDTGITAANLADEFTRVWPDQEFAVARNLLARAGDAPGSGAETARQATLGQAGLTGLAALAGPTSGAVVPVAIRYQRMVSVAARYSLEDGGGAEVAVVLDGEAIPADVRDFCVERDAALIFVAGRVVGSAVEIRLRMSAERGRALAAIRPFDRWPAPAAG
jgi:hypothetical protein